MYLSSGRAIVPIGPLLRVDPDKLRSIESTTTGILGVVLGGSGLFDLGAGFADSGSERSYCDRTFDNRLN